MVHRVDIPVGKTLVPTEIVSADPESGYKVNCKQCCLWNSGPCYEKMACRSQDRADKKDVYYVFLNIEYEEEKRKKRYKPRAAKTATPTGVIKKQGINYSCFLINLNACYFVKNIIIYYLFDIIKGLY